MCSKTKPSFSLCHHEKDQINLFFIFKHLDCCNEQKILHTLFSLSLHALFLFCVLSNAKEQSCRSRLTSVFCWPSGGIKVNKTVITIADSDLLSMKK